MPGHFVKLIVGITMTWFPAFENEPSFIKEYISITKVVVLSIFDPWAHVDHRTLIALDDSQSFICIQITLVIGVAQGAIAMLSVFFIVEALLYCAMDIFFVIEPSSF